MAAQGSAAQPGTIRPSTVLRPATTADHLSRSRHMPFGLVVVLMAMMVAMAAFIGSAVNANVLASRGSQTTFLANDAWTFGVATIAMVIAQTGITIVLWGIVRRLWIRVESVKVGLAKLVPDVPNKMEITSPRIPTPYGRAKHTERAPRPLFVHRMAYAMWGPMWLMGVMLAVVGLVISFVQAAAGADGDTGGFLTLASLSQGFLFFGMHLVLLGISFMLGAILGSLRQGGGEVQESLGVAVKTLEMPLLVKGFLVLMMMGMMLAMLHFVAYLFVATLDSPETIRIYFAWLAPLRKATVGIILSGIVLSLAAIGTKVLPFQFWRVQQLIREGR